MELNLKKNEKLAKIITVILAGVLILIIIMPVKESVNESGADSGGETTYEDNYIYYEEYYESKLKGILEKSYGEGTMQVMVRVSSEDKKNDYYGNDTDKFIVEGVIVVADVTDSRAVSDISFAVCALFDLPAHKVAVMYKN